MNATYHTLDQLIDTVVRAHQSGVSLTHLRTLLMDQGMSPEEFDLLMQVVVLEASTKPT